MKSVALISFFLFLSLSAIYLFGLSPAAAKPPQTPESTDATQVLKATYGPPFGFYPTEFTARANTSVRLEVTALENGRGCMGSIMLPDFSPKIETFVKGKTHVFEFTPTAGTYYITCAMGIPHATIT